MDNFFFRKCIFLCCKLSISTKTMFFLEIFSLFFYQNIFQKDQAINRKKIQINISKKNCEIIKNKIKD